MFGILHLPVDTLEYEFLLGEDNQYDKARIFDQEDMLTSARFEELEIALTDIFQER